jgi:signal recognition particle GTPase
MQYDHHLSSVEKEGDVIPDESEDESNDDDNFEKDEENDEGQPSNDSRAVRMTETTLKNVQKWFRREDQVFSSTFDALKNKLWHSIQADTVDRFVNELSENIIVKNVCDHLGRSILHAAVEQQNVNLVECLLHAGFNPNV